MQRSQEEKFRVQKNAHKLYFNSIPIIMPEEFSRLDKGIIFATGALFLDVIVGQAFTGRPLHESIGIGLSDYLQKGEDLTLALGGTYTLFKPYHMRQRKIGRKQYRQEL